MLVMPPREKARREHEEREKRKERILNGLLNEHEKATVSGDNITINDCIEAPADIVLRGKEIKQYIRDGYNILNPEQLSGTNFTFDNDTLIIDSNIAFANVRIDITDIIKEHAGETLYFTSEEIDFSNAIKPGLQTIYRTNESSSYIYNAISSSKSGKIVIPSETSNITAYLIGFYSNNTNEITHTVAIWKKPMLAFKENAKYEQYGQSPSTDYPSPIEYVEGNQEVEHVNKNYAKIDNLRSEGGNSGIKIEEQENGTFILNGIATRNFRIIADTFFKPKNQQMTYTVEKISGTINRWISSSIV